jgi:tetratricopeptide (TPR) repeat protein
LGSQQLIREGRLEDALRVYLGELQGSPKSLAANNGAGVVLDLMGRYPDARKYFTQAIKSAATPLERAQAQRAMTISYAFTGDCRGAEKYDRAAFDFFHASGDFYDAGEVADELGRLCLDAGELDIAYEWYRRGHDAALLEEKIAPARVDLWNFRWAHARARIAARRGKEAEAAKYVAAAKAILDKGTNPEQQAYLPLLTGYVAFYRGDYAGALAELRNANAADPFVQCLMAQCHEKLGDMGAAREYYRQAAAATAHSVPVAYARPFALGRL